MEFMELKKSSYEELKNNQSQYHFDPYKMDTRWDCVQGLGRFSSDFSEEREWIKNHSEASSWRTRKFGAKSGRGDGGQETPPNNWIEAEEYDIANGGGDPNMSICHMGLELTPKLQKMCDMIGLENGHDKTHMQVVGEVFNIHIDKLGRIYPQDHTKIMRIVVMLSDWEPGHFYQYGNHVYTGWKAGDIHTFAWKHVPHCTANAGRNPRYTLVTTGIATEKTYDFLKHAANIKEIII
jgi:hypothetical protein